MKNQKEYLLLLEARSNEPKTAAYFTAELSG